MERVRAIHRDNPSTAGDGAGSTAAEAMLEFGRFRVLLRQRRLVTDGVPIELGTRAFDLLLVLLEADGSLVTKEELMSRVWPGIVVAEENLKVQIFTLRKALGEDRDFIRTEVGRGYRFTARVCSAVSRGACRRPVRRARRSTHQFVRQRTSRRQLHGWCVPRSLRPSL
jgi:DNA-binding winged helix-turn-helix (wHTH) protein